MALAYNVPRTTADVDGVFEPKAVIYEPPAASPTGTKNSRPTGSTTG
jgi:hypothetical protein